MSLLDEIVGVEKDIDEPMKLKITNSFSRDLLNCSLQIFEDGDEMGKVDMDIDGNNSDIFQIEFGKERDTLNFEFKFLDQMGKELSAYTCTVRTYVKNDENGNPSYYRRLDSALNRKPISRKRTEKVDVRNMEI